MRFAISAGVTRCAAVLSLFLLGCGPDFDPPSELHSLRVLGVQKDVPYAQPGDMVTLSMLWEDAALERGRPVQLAWSAPCINPPGDLYYGCFTDPSTFNGMGTLNSETKSFTMPTDIISSKRVQPGESNNAPYGLAYLFFAACAGTLGNDAPANTLPITCKDAAGNLLGSDDFVVGYTAVYAFKSFSNHNPVISGFRFHGQDLEAGEGAAKPGFCVDAACLPLDGVEAPQALDCSDPAQAPRCIPTCADDGDSKCPAYGLRPTIDKTDPANQDQDDVSAQLLGRNVGEQMWINYYTLAGSFKSPVRLLNDATSGWNDDYGTEFYAPKAAGPFRVWAVAHDNRGGVSWSGVTLQAE